MRTTCLLALLSLWLLAQASASPKRLEKKSIVNSLAPKAIEPVEQKLDAPSPKISDEELMESPGETVERAKKQTTTFCVEVRQNKPTYVDCNEVSPGTNADAGNKIFVVPGNDLHGQDPVGPPGGTLGPSDPPLPGIGFLGPHSLHVPHHVPHAPHHGVHFSGPGTADTVPTTIHYVFPGSDGSGLGPHGLGPQGGPNDGGLNGILYQIPGSLPSDPTPNGAGPSGVHVHVHPPGGFPSGPSSSSSPVHLSGIECLCTGTPAMGRADDGMPSNEALAVKFLQDLQRSDKPEGDGAKAVGGEQSPADQPSGTPTILLPKAAGLPLALPMMIGGLPMTRTSYVPYGWPAGLNRIDAPTANGIPLMRTLELSVKAPTGSPTTTGEAPAPDGSAPNMRSGFPYGSYNMAYSLPLMGVNAPMMRPPGGTPMMGIMPMIRAGGGVPMMGGMPPMRTGGSPMMGGTPLMGGLPIMRADSTPTNPEHSNPPVPLMIQMPSAKSGEIAKNPPSPSGVQISIMPSGSPGENPTPPNGQPLRMLSVPMRNAGDNAPVPTSPSGSPLTIISMPMGKSGENAPAPTSPNGSPLNIISMPMGKDGANPAITNMPNGLHNQLLSGPPGPPRTPDGSADASILLHYQPLRPMQYPLFRPSYGSPLNGQMYHIPGGYMAPYSPHVIHTHRSPYDCLEDSFQSAPLIQGLRFSRGPDESKLPTGGQQPDAEDKPEGAVGSEHTEPARGDDKESRISHFVADDHDDAANSI